MCTKIGKLSFPERNEIKFRGLKMYGNSEVECNSTSDDVSLLDRFSEFYLI